NLDVVEAQCAIERPEAPDEARQLVGDLVLATEDVTVVLRELSEAEEAVQRPGGLVPVHQTELGEAQGQVAPGRTQAAHELHVSGTADGLQRPGLPFDREHPVAEDAPVPAALPDGLGQNLGASHLAVPLAANDAPEVVLQRAEELEPAWVPEDAPGGLLLEGEEPEAVAEGAVIIVVQHGRARVMRPGVTSGTVKRASSRPPRRNHGRDGDGVLEGFRPPTHTRRSDPPRGWWSWWWWCRDSSRG